MRLGILATHPVQYLVPLYREIASRGGVELTVHYLHRHGVESSFDEGFGREVRFDVPLLEGYPFEFLPNLSLRPGLTALGMVSPSVVERLSHLDAMVVVGYNHLTPWLAAMANAAWSHKALLFRGDSQLGGERSAWRLKVKAPPLRYFLSLFDGILAIGTRNREYYEHYGVPREKIRIAPFSVDGEYFRSKLSSYDRRATRAHLGIPDDATVFLSVSKFVPVKDLQLLVSSFARARLGARAVLLLVGTGPLESELRRQVDELGISEWVRFVGFVNQSALPEFYGAADAFVLGSKTESWGLVVNEAMACGLPVIVSDRVGAAPDLVEGIGQVFPSGDVEALSSALSLWTHDSAARALAKTRAEAKIATWGLKQTADAFIETAREAHERRRSRARS